MGRKKKPQKRPKRAAKPPKRTTLPQHAENEPKQELVRADWEMNHLLIEQAYFEIVQTEKRTPTLEEVSQKTNISRQSISRHLKSLDLGEVREATRLFIRKVLMAQATRAMKTGARDDVLTYMKLNFDWSEKLIIDNQNGKPIADEQQRRDRIARLLATTEAGRKLVADFLGGKGFIDPVGDRGEIQEAVVLENEGGNERLLSESAGDYTVE